MILEFIQEERIPHAIHKITVGSQIIGTASCEKFLNGEMILMDKQFDISIPNLSDFPIMSNGIEVGHVYQRFIKTGKFLFFDSGYSYYEFKYEDTIFTVYDIGLGKNKHFYQFEINKETVAIIHKPDKVKNRKDTYTCYLSSDDMIIPVSLWCLFLESSAYYDMLAEGEGNVEIEKSHTSQKVVRELYDPTFIPRIKQQDGIID